MPTGQRRAHDGERLLFSPLTLREVTVKNRIMSSAMCQYRSVDGAPQDWHLAYLGRLAIGGTGLIFHEETAVSPGGRKTYDCAGLWSRIQLPAYRRLVALLHGCGAAAGIQIGHAGAKGSSNGAMKEWSALTEEDARDGRPPWETISPSGIATGPDRPAPRVLEIGDIPRLIDEWAASAHLAAEAGFDVLEIHGAHGYLIHQFLSPVTNRRGDAYGGDRRGRMRLALEIASAVRVAWPDEKPLFFRTSCVDGKGGVWNIEDTVVLARELKALGVDVIDCSSGGLSGTSDMPLVPRGPGYHVDFARAVSAGAGIPTLAPGNITRPEEAEALLQGGQVALVAMARALMETADWPVAAARALGLSDPYGAFPEDMAFRLRRREEIARLERENAIDESGTRLIEST